MAYGVRLLSCLNMSYCNDSSTWQEPHLRRSLRLQLRAVPLEAVARAVERRDQGFVDVVQVRGDTDLRRLSGLIHSRFRMAELGLEDRLGWRPDAAAGGCGRVGAMAESGAEKRLELHGNKVGECLGREGAYLSGSEACACVAFQLFQQPICLGALEVWAW